MQVGRECVIIKKKVASALGLRNSRLPRVAPPHKCYFHPVSKDLNEDHTPRILGPIVYKFTKNSVPGHKDLEALHFPRRYDTLVRGAAGQAVIFYHSAVTRRGGEYFATGIVGHELTESFDQRLRVRIHSVEHFKMRVSFHNKHGLPREWEFNGRNWRSHAERVIRSISGREHYDILVASEPGSVGAANRSPSMDQWDNDIGWSPGPEDEFGHLASYQNRQARVRAALRALALERYAGRCIFTGIRQPLGTRLPDQGADTRFPLFLADACHIRSLAAMGPDHISNMFLCLPTFHDLHDLGFLGFSDNFTILVSPDVVPSLRSQINPDGQAALPADRALWPNLEYIRWHRNNIFRGVG